MKGTITYVILALWGDEISIFAGVGGWGDDAGVSVVGGAALVLVEPDPEPGAAVAPAAHVAHRDAPARGTVGRVPVVEGRLPIL